MGLLQLLKLRLELVERQSARFEDVQLEHVAPLGETSCDQHHREQILQFYERLGQQLLVVAGEERMQRHLHVVLQVVQRTCSRQTLQRLEQLVDPASAEGAQVSEALLGQLSR